MIALTVNGQARELTAPDRTHLADLLREHCGLTGTHLGCEQGVCGACTVLVDNQPQRACLIHAGEAAGLCVTTIEGLDDDPVAAALRGAFNRHHALQCGYCTPGMMITARDIVLRLGHLAEKLDEARIREELAGNLCRCTGYRGIVRAIAEVAATRPAVGVPPRSGFMTPPRSGLVNPPRSGLVNPPQSGLANPTRSGVLDLEPPASPRRATSVPAPATAPLANTLQHEEPVGLDVATAWAILSDPARVAACVPGARLLRQDGTALEGEVAVALGPFTARFAGQGVLVLDETGHRGTLRGHGRDGANGAEGEVAFQLRPAAAGCLLRLDLGWRLTGPLAQFSRPALLRGLVAGLAADFARNLEATAQGVAPAPVSIWRLLRRLVRGWLPR